MTVAFSKTVQSGSKIVILLALIAAATATQLRELVRSHAAASKVESARPRVELVTLAPTTSRVVVGDARLGAQLYAINCVSCHGFSGEGDGPATSFLHPVARDHTSPYMATRSDEQLYQTIDLGGARTNVSSLMPSFSDHFDDLEKWSLVAYLRTLHPHVEMLVPTGTKLAVEPVIVSSERAARFKPAFGSDDLGVELVRAYFDASGREQTIAYLAAARVAGAPSSLWVALRRDPDGALTKHALPAREVRSARGDLFPDLLERAAANDPNLGNVPLPPEVAALVSSVQVTATRLEQRMRAAVEELEADEKDATEIYERSKSRPTELSPVQRTFLQNCASCHGPNGRGVGPNVTRLAVRPRDLADGGYLNQLPDEHLASMIQFGGGPMRHSALMPGFGNGTLSDPEVQELVRYVRSLAIPPYVPGVAHAHHH